MRLAYKWQAALVTALGLFMAVLDNTIVSVALPQMQNAFHTDLATITWVATAYFLAQAAVIPVTGYLSDRIGTKPVYIAALAIFVLGSGLCAIAPSEGALIAFRIFQGIGGGALFPLVFAIIFRIFPPAERGPASAVVGVPVLLAPAFGPTIGGYLTTTFDWRAIFTINLPIGVVALVLAWTILRGQTAEQEANGVAGEPARRRGFDAPGLLLAMVGFTVLAYGINKAGTDGLGDRGVQLFLLGGLLALAIFTVVELRVSDPVLDVRLFASYTFTSANLLLWAVSAFLFGSLFLLPFFFEQVQGKTPLNAGLILIAQGISSAVGTFMSGRLYNRVGPRILAVVGFALVTLGTVGFASLSVDSTWQSVQLSLILRGLGLGLSNIPLQTLSLSGVSNRAMARASSLVNVTRQVASAIGVSAFTAYLTQQGTSYGNSIKDTLTTAQRTHTAPTGAAGACIAPYHGNPQLIQAHLAAVGDCVKAHALASGLDDTFKLIAIGCAACIALALFVGRDPSLQRIREAEARGEVVEAGPVVVAE